MHPPVSGPGPPPARENFDSGRAPPESKFSRPGHAPPPPAAALKPASPASKPAAAAKRDHDLANGGAAPSGEGAAKQLAVPGDGSFEIRRSGRSMRAARPRVGSAVASGEASK